MRMVGLTVGLVLLGSGPVWSEEIYHWTDGQGTLHFSNTPSTDVPWTRLSDVAPAVPTPAPGRADPEAATAGDATFSSDVSIRRNALERDLRATQKRLRDVDARLATLGRARNQHARGSAATGGVGTLAIDVRSDEERALATERAQLAQHADEARNEGVKLRDEVTARLGAIPPWWNDVR